MKSVKEIIADKLDVSIEKIKPEVEFINGLGIDSLDGMELIMKFEYEYDIAIEDDDISKVSTVKDMADLLAEYGVDRKYLEIDSYVPKWSANQVKAAMLASGRKRFNERPCSICGYQVGFVIKGGELFLNNGCNCNTRSNITPQSWQSVADFINTRYSSEDIAYVEKEFCLVEPEKPIKRNCYKCIYRGCIMGSAHSTCSNSKASVVGNKGGIERGWFSWPLNFDPVWLISCDGFKEK